MVFRKTQAGPSLFRNQTVSMSVRNISSLANLPSELCIESDGSRVRFHLQRIRVVILEVLLIEVQVILDEGKNGRKGCDLDSKHRIREDYGTK